VENLTPFSIELLFMTIFTLGWYILNVAFRRVIFGRGK
jgi:hypothetical protein